MDVATEAGLRARLLAGEPLDLTALGPERREAFPELAALAGVPAGRQEGSPGESALAHTQRVLALVQPQLASLPAERAQTLYLAALLHEVGRGVGPSRHERVSASLARQILFRLQLPPPLRDHVVYLVRSHTRPQRAARRPVRPEGMLRLAWTLDTELLYRLALAGCRARGPGGEGRCPAVEAFRRRYREMGILGREPAPLLPPGRWRELTPADPRLRRRLAGEVRYRRLRGVLSTAAQAVDWLQAQRPAAGSNLYLPVGVPGSGKTTWVQRELPQAQLVSMDQVREWLLGDRRDQSRNRQVYGIARGQLARAMRAGQTVVWDAQSHTWSARKGLLGLAREAHAYVVMVYFDVPLAVALDRNTRRQAVVPEGVIRRSYEHLEEPRPFEAEEIWRVGVDGQCTRYVWDENAGA